jgi:hypothetical protein
MPSKTSKLASSAGLKKVGEFAQGYAAGFGTEVLAKYIESPGSILRTQLIQLGPNAWLGPDDIIISAAVPLLHVAFKKYVGAVAALAGALTVQGLQLLGGGITPITAAPLGLTPVYPRIPPSSTVPRTSFYAGGQAGNFF